MLLAARNLDAALKFVDGLAPDDPRWTRSGGRQEGLCRYELAGHTSASSVLGKVGCLVADAAIKLGMDVIGYDPEITVESAWSLRRRSERPTIWGRCSSTASSLPCTCR